MPSDRDLLTTTFRCNLCNVISRGIIEHDKHLEGKRHKKNVAVATGEAAAPAAQPKKRAAISGNETKQDRKKRLEHEAVSRASLLLNPALQQRPSFTHVVLNWARATWASGPLALPSERLPSRFCSREIYLESWEPFLLEEARCALQAGLDDSTTAVHLTLRSFKAAGDIPVHAGLSDPSTLAFSIPDSSGGANGDGAAERRERIQSGSAVLLTPPQSLCGLGAGDSLPEGWTEYTQHDGPPYYHHANRGITQWERPSTPASFLGIVTQRTKLGVEIQLVLPVSMTCRLEAGLGWECSLLASVASLMRMYDSCVALRDTLPERFRTHLLDAKPPHLPRALGTAALTSQASRCLNSFQRAAVTAAVHPSLSTPAESAICLVHGPPGTGKTTTIIACLQELRGRPSTGTTPRRVLVCAPSNKAVQELCGRFVAGYPDVPVSLVGVGEIPEGTEGDALRSVLVSSWAENLASKIRESIAHSAAGVRACADTKSLAKLLDAASRRVPDTWQRHCRQDHKALAPWFERMKYGVPCDASTPAALDAILKTLLSLASSAALSQPIEAELMSTAEIIFCTLATAGRPSLAGRLSAHALVVDEAAQALEPEVLIALRQADYCAGTLERMILVGDPQQLPATLLSSRVAQLGLNRSMLQRLLEGCGDGAGNMFQVMLAEQHRMDPEISAWPSKRFYRGLLVDAACVRLGKRIVDIGMPLKPYTVVDVSEEYVQQCGQTGAAKIGTSLGNRAEAKLAALLAARIVEGSKAPANAVAIISFYSGQVSLVQRELMELPAAAAARVRVATVDGFQGAEAGIIVLSFVRGLACTGVGFLDDFRRLNVALTRAKSALVVLANVQALSRDPSWDVAALCRDAEERGLVVPAAAFRGMLS